jgi:hypothetical protein
MMDLGTGTKNSSDDELERQKVEVMELQKQMQTSRDHYQNSIIQANAQIQKLEMEVTNPFLSFFNLFFF